MPLPQPPEYLDYGVNHLAHLFKVKREREGGRISLCSPRSLCDPHGSDFSVLELQPCAIALAAAACFYARLETVL